MADISSNIHVDTNDEDSSFGDSDILSDTTSLKSSILNYHYENGRRYHAYRKGSYWGPNDEQAADNLDIAHHIFNLTLGGKLYLAPIGEDIHRVLDVGTGTGIWAIDFADQHPSASVIGTDLSPIQPTDIPPNLQFEIDDCTEEWLYAKDSFDFIHVRCLYGSIADWPAFYKQVFSHLKPGGWIEQVEGSVVPKSDDGTVKPGSPLHKWGELSLKCGDLFGKTLLVVDEAKQNIIDTGFIDVVEHRYKWPIGDWPRDPHLKEIGMYNRLFWEDGIEGWSMYLLTNVLKWSREEVMVYLAQVRSALRDRSIHAYIEISVVYGRKPPKRETDTEG
ncbi:uncharacterized protein PV09_06904 [Verruconis gallopava]|uniref:Methyltransferase domain-containing protein n=1 Tax=Verruconis gallopava TaxID=253628 RepID=A0A0D1YLL2_9PEZI|nr:uncharacterized protein PV09_06904 [Verruconis gallopava]KIW01727.1 hypothetical protein PV09_06904 [Verruconis gallopava]